MWRSRRRTGGEDSLQEEEPRPVSGSQPPSSARQSMEPTERTRLLQGSRSLGPAPDGYLDPDDPAVSPYNLWTVRFVRYITVLFTMITFVWWVLLFVSIFVTPPGLNTRGSGFTDFSYTCLNLGNLLVCLIFFTGPSQAVRITTSIVTVLLMVDVIIIAAVPKIRMEEGWPGIASATAAFVISGWCILVDRVVAWGKREEEERLTGRPEKRRTLQEWLGVLVSTIITIGFILIVILLTGTLILRALDASLEEPGVRINVDNGKYAVHVDCIGEVKVVDGVKQPTILLEGGERPSEGTGLSHWTYAAYQNTTIARYCYWDRPGYAWSDNAPSPHSAGMSANALGEALARKGETGPWISVSAGYGSVVARIFAANHRYDVTGIMLIDPLHEDLLYTLAAPSKGFLTWAYGIISPLGIQRLGGAIFNGRDKEDRVYGAVVTQSGRFLKAKLQENLVADSLTKTELVNSRVQQPADTPLVVISSGINVRRDSEWARKQKDLSQLTENLVAWDTIEGAEHEVWLTGYGGKVMEKRLGQLVAQSKKQK